MKTLYFLIVILICFPATSFAQITITNATVYTGTGEPLKGASVVVGADGKIKAVGTTVTAIGEKIDGTGKIVTPGFIDSSSQLATTEIWAAKNTNDASPGNFDRDKDVIQPGFRTVDAINPNAVAIPVTRKGGVTSVIATPYGSLISGQSAHLEMNDVRFFGAVTIDEVALNIAYGGRSSRFAGGSRGGSLALIREAFEDAKYLNANPKEINNNRGKKPYLSVADVKSLTAAATGKMPVVFSVNRANDILAVLKLSAAYKLRPIIAGGAEAWIVSKELKAANASVILDTMLNVPSDFDALGARVDNVIKLQKAGVPVMLTADDSHNVRNLRFYAGNAVREGLPYNDAITAITKTPADAFGLDDVGELKAGKRANVVLWSGDPFQPASFVELMLIGGKKASLKSRQTSLFNKYRILDRRGPPAEPKSKSDDTKTEEK